MPIPQSPRGRARLFELFPGDTVRDTRHTIGATSKADAITTLSLLMEPEEVGQFVTANFGYCIPIALS